MNVAGNMFPRFIETDRRKNCSRKAPPRVESNLTNSFTPILAAVYKTMAGHQISLP